jgi:hypothetical protein
MVITITITSVGSLVAGWIYELRSGPKLKLRGGVLLIFEME